ncbi:MAG: hypothetical protein IKM29_02980 [Clostridia bacterium]|nr:hypothetical protein [Clostridia bacterium]
MTYGELLDRALGILEYGDRQGRETFAKEMTDLVLAELWDINNRLRSAKGLEPLEEIPCVNSFDDVIPYEAEIVRRDLILGLVCRLSADEEDASLHNFYSAEYAVAKREHRDRTELVVDDYYS